MPTSRLSTLSLAIIASGSTHAVTIDFESLIPYETVSGYSQDGYIISTNHPNGFRNIGPSTSLNYTGSSTLTPIQTGSTTSLTRINSETFDLNSIDLAELLDSPAGNSPTSVVFTGIYQGGGSASYTANLDLNFGLETFDFGSLFHNVVSVSWKQGNPFHQFDNIVIDETSVTISAPATLALLGLGFVGTGLAQYKRKEAV